MFLSSYYRILAPLGFRGLHFAKTKFDHIFANLSNQMANTFDQVLENHHIHDLTLPKLNRQMNAVKTNDVLSGTEFPYFNISEEQSYSSKNILYSSDGKTHMIIDRIINNIGHMKIIEDLRDHNVNTSFAARFLALNVEMGETLVKSLSIEEYEKIKPHVLRFTSEASLLDKGIGHVLNGLRSVMALSVNLFGRAIQILSNYLPMYWNLATLLMYQSIKIPFVYKWYTEKFSRGKSDLTLTDLLCLLGATISTWTYKLYNSNYAPYTSLDVEVLRSNKEPELILYTWGHDPRTSDQDDEITRVHRLGMHDWIPRIHTSTLSAFSAILYDVPLAYSTKDINNPGYFVLAPRYFNTMAGVMQRVSYYPFTQVSCNGI